MAIGHLLRAATIVWQYRILFEKAGVETGSYGTKRPAAIILYLAETTR